MRAPTIAFAALLTLALAAAAVADTGFVACSTSDSAVPFDLATYAPVGSALDLLPEGNYPYDCTMRPDGSEVWICGASGDGVVVIEVDTQLITHRIDVWEYPNSVVFTDDGLHAMVSSRDEDLVAIIDTGTYDVVDSLLVSSGSSSTYDSPGQLALDPVSQKIYAADWYGDTLYELASDGLSVKDMVDIGSSLWQLVVDPDGEYIYVTDRGSDVVRVVEQATLTEFTTVPVGDDPWGIDVTDDGSKLVVACEDDSNVYVIDTSDWSTTTIALEQYADPRDVDILDSDGYAFVTGGVLLSSVTKVYVIQLSDNTLKDSFTLVGGTNANAIAVQPQMTSDGTGVVDAGVNGLGLSCFPNPFNPKTVLSYHLPTASDVELAVYDVSGRRVAVLEDGTRDPGDHEVVWLGRDGTGREVATGVYFIRLTTEMGEESAKAVLLK